MSAALEGQYRQALRWYPKSWRTRNEDVVLGTLLDVADEDGRDAPAKGELANLRNEALASRFRWIDRVLPSPVRDRVSAIAYGTGFGIALVAALFSLINVPQLYLQPENDNPVTFGPFLSPAIVLYGLWILAFVTRAVGFVVIARVLLVLSILAGFAARFVGELVLFDNVFPTTTFVTVMALLALLALLGGAARSVRSLAWLGSSLAVSLAALAVILYQARAFPLEPHGFFFEAQVFIYGGYVSVIPLVGIAAALVAVAMKQWVWARVAAISSLPWVALFFGVQSRYQFPDAGWMSALILTLLAAAAVAFRLAGFRIRITRA